MMVCPWVALLLVGWLPAENRSALVVHPTALVDRSSPPRQRIDVDVELSEAAAGCRLQAWADKRLVADAELGSIKPGRSTLTVLLPEPSQAAEIRWVLIDGHGRRVVESDGRWSRPRHWTLYLLKSAHIDIGLHEEAYWQRALVSQLTDEAQTLVRQTADWPEPARFRYVIEHQWWLANYAADRPAGQMKRLIDEYIKTGRIGVGAGHSGNHTQEFGIEEFCRATYYGRREARDRWGLDPRTAIFADVTGLSWPLVRIFFDAGIRYVCFFPNAWRGGPNLGPGVPKLFYWLDPSGQSKVLVWACSHYSCSHWLDESGNLQHFQWRGKWIPRSARAFDFTSLETLQAKLPAALRALEKEVPYTIWLLPSYADNERPSLALAGVARGWNAKYRWPELRTVGDPSEPFREAERLFGDRIPTLSGDITSSWAQHTVSTPEYLGKKRAADRLLATAEKLCTIARLADPSFVYPTAELRQAWDALIQSDEHGYGVSGYKGKRVYVTWAHKRGWIDYAYEVARRETSRALGAIAARIDGGQGPAVVVFNPLLQERTDLASCELAGPGPVRVVCSMTGEPMPSETIGKRVVFLARQVPSLGYKVFRLLEAKVPDTEAGPSQANPPVLENQDYRIRFAVDGAIASLWDKELQRELVDASAPHRLNQFLFTADDHKSFSSPASAEFALVRSPLGQTVRARVREPRSGAAIVQEVTLQEHQKRIDLDNRLEHVSGLVHKDRYLAYAYYAFPLLVPGGVIRAQLNGCVARPHDDQTRIGIHDWLAVQDWVDVSSPEFGITWAQQESHLVEFGRIRTNQNSQDGRPARPYLYSYLANDWFQKCWASPRDVRLHFRYSLTSHRGDWREGQASRFGARVAGPLLATVVARAENPSLPRGRHSFLDVAAGNVELLTLKPSHAPGQGIIARFWETEGAKTDALRVRTAWPELGDWRLCSIPEDLLGPTAGQRISFAPHAIVTVRMSHPGARLASPVVEAEAASDKAVRLRWSPVAGAVQYHAFRGAVADFRADAYSFLAATTKAELVDDWLSRDTTYYYRVAAVDRWTGQGEASPAVPAKTSAEDRSPPGPIGRDWNGLIGRGQAWHAEQADKLYLLWGRNGEPDLSHYELYRGRDASFKPADESLIAKVPPGEFAVVSYDDSGLRPGTRYYYRVRAVDAAGHRGPLSDIFSGKTRDAR